MTMISGLHKLKFSVNLRELRVSVVNLYLR